MIDAWRLDQGAATERPPFRRLHIAARRRDGRGKRGVQPATDLAVGRLEHVDRRDAAQAQPQPQASMPPQPRPQPAPAAWLSETETRPIVAVNSAAAAAVLIFAGVKLAIPSVKTLG